MQTRHYDGLKVVINTRQYDSLKVVKLSLFHFVIINSINYSQYFILIHGLCENVSYINNKLFYSNIVFISNLWKKIFLDWKKCINQISISRLLFHAEISVWANVTRYTNFQRNDINMYYDITSGSDSFTVTMLYLLYIMDMKNYKG